jgi:hypothetical protein
MEMGKDFEIDCPSIRVSINQQMADYTVILNHIEQGFVRDTQLQIADRSGDLIAKTKEGGCIDGGVKKACALILADCSKKQYTGIHRLEYSNNLLFRLLLKQSHILYQRPLVHVGISCRVWL